MTATVDLSSFPLLRIDQLHLHETQTLLRSETELKKLQLKNDMQSIAPFVDKLLDCIRKEVDSRRTNHSRTATYLSRPQPTSAKNSRNKLPQWRSNNATSSPSTSSKNNIVSFVSTPKSSSNFRSRAKSARDSLKARSETAMIEQLEQRRTERTRQALDKIQSWKVEREKSKAQREALFEEEERLRRQRRNERMEKEKQVRDSMQAAAEEAKAKAIESGCTEESAIVAAAVAAANLFDDGNSSVDSDDGSYLNDASSDMSKVLPNELFDGESNHEDSSDRIIDENQTNSRDKPDETSLIDAAKRTNVVKSTLEENAEHCLSKDSHQNNSIPRIHIDTGASTDEEQDADSNNRSEPSDNEFISLEEEQDKISLADNDAKVKEGNELLEHETLIVNDESDNSQVSLSSYVVDQLISDEVKSAASPTSATNENEENPPIVETAFHRRLRNVLPSFSSIFTNFAKKGRCHIDDSSQKELIACMQNQIKLHELHTCQSTQSDDDSFFGEDVENCRFYRINSRRPEVRALLDEVFSHHALSEWNELPEHISASKWNLLWTWGLPSASLNDNLLVFQKINRFRHTKGLTRKDLLKKSMQRFGCGHLMPLTFALPHEYNAFVAAYTSINKSSTSKEHPNFWIVKPIGLSRGRGISVVKDISQVAYSQPIVIQRYISNPMLFLGYKFDLRIYLLVTSFNPLEAFIYKEGLARFGSRKYSNKPESLGDNRIHLTNSSLQREFDIADKSHPAFLAGSNGSGSKVALSWLWKRLEAKGLDTSDMWKKVKSVCKTALESVDADIPNQPNSFELFGFDVIFDTDGGCWIIEVNSSPSLGCDSSLDNRIKGNLIVDTISLVDPIAYDRSALATVCDRRITHRKRGFSLEEDLGSILSNSLPRQIGEKPKRRGNFENIT